MDGADDRYLRGLDIMARSGLARVQPFTSRVAEVSPEFARLAIEIPFGEILARPALDLRIRHLIAVAMLAAVRGAEPQLRLHVESALELGWSRAEIAETLIQAAIHAGFPAALNALAACHDQLTDDTCAPCHSSGSGDGHS